MFSPLHALTLLLFTLAWAGLIRVGARLHGSALEARWRALLGAVVLACWLWANAVQLMPGRYIPAESLPVQICDIAGLLLPFAIWTRRRLLQAGVYFWGGSFSIIAMLAPDLRSGMASIDFWTFWLPHGNLTGAAFYLVLVEGYRPSWSEAQRVFALSVLYVMLILPFDLARGFNYGYVGPDNPLQPPLIDLLGPWPWRILVIIALTAGVFTLLQLPWRRRDVVAEGGA